jgi:hypothetical protein
MFIALLLVLLLVLLLLLLLLRLWVSRTAAATLHVPKAGSVVTASGK